MSADDTPPSEAVNELTLGLDGVSATAFVRALRACDGQLFRGWKSHAGLLDARLSDAFNEFLSAQQPKNRKHGKK